MRALVTAGGTREPIDDVRVISNRSGGRFGVAIACALVARGIPTTLLAGAELARRLAGSKSRFTVRPFDGFADLARALEEEAATPPDLIFMAAAVSDYAPLPTAGKIASEHEELVIQLRRNPKLLASFRERFGRRAFIVGFKLTSGVSADALVAAAHEQVRRCRLNLTVGNDLTALGSTAHPVVLATPEGGAIPLTGSREDVAAALVDFCLRRAAVRWGKTEPSSSPPPPPQPPSLDEGRERAARLLGFAQLANLLPGVDGNVSARCDVGLWTTPRQVVKATVASDELLYARVDLSTRIVQSYGGERRSSIDTLVHAHLYDRFPSLEALLHFHDALVLPTATTRFAFPCGSVEEADEIHEVLMAAATGGTWDGRSFAVELTHHGYLVGLVSGDTDALLAGWNEILAAHDDHLRDVGATGPFDRQPVFDGGTIVGAAIRQGAAISLFLHPRQRGRSLGDRVIERIIDDRRDVVALDDCRVAAYYEERGFAVAERVGPLLRLVPPSKRSDLVHAASIALVDPIERRVLLGRRRTEPFLGYWAFPGGGVEEGETPIDAARRELFEETGVRIDLSRPALVTRVYVGAPSVAVSVPGRAYAVDNVAFLVARMDEPSPSSELEARWVSLDDTEQLRPMAAGTRRVLRRLRQRM